MSSLYKPPVDPKTSSKEIKVNAASLVDLKAELYKKQEQYERARANPALQSSSHTAPGTSEKKSLWSKQNRGVADRSKNDLQATSGKVHLSDNSATYDEARRALEAKAELYGRLESGEARLEDNKYLVDFSAKPRTTAHAPEQRSHLAGIDDEELLGDPEETLEFTDSLGRTRLCKRKELRELLEMDAELRRADETKRSRRRQSGSSDSEGSETSSGSDSASDRDDASDDASEDEEGIRRDPRNASFVTVAPPSSYKYSNSDRGQDRGQDRDRRGSLPKKRKHESTRAGESSRKRTHVEELSRPAVRFQAVLGTEVRTLGAGYFGFSTDEDERTRQMNLLASLREQTLKQREAREQLRLRRKEATEKRLEQIRARRALKQAGAEMLIPPQEASPEALPDAAPSEPEEGVGMDLADTADAADTAGATGGRVESAAIDQFLAFFKSKFSQQQ